MRDDSFEKLLDFLQWDENNANTICSFIDDLTSEGFEHYISEYYKKIHGFTTAVTWGFNDKGMDVKWLRLNEKWEREHLIVQCKKWNWGPKWIKDKYYIWENLIAQFYGKVADHKNSWNVRLVYATTKDVMPWAKIFCKEKDIELITYKELVEINREMNLKEWIEEILTSDISQKEKERLISKEYRERRDLFLQEKRIIIQETKQEILIERTKNIPLEQKNYFNIFAKLILVIFFCYVIWYFIIMILWFINQSISRSFEEPVRNTEISTIQQNNTENIVPTRKKNIQTTRHIITP